MARNALDDFRALNDPAQRREVERRGDRSASGCRSAPCRRGCERPENLGALYRNAAAFGAHAVLLVGAEGPGLAEPTLDAAIHRAAIPMAPAVDSVNVATAAAVALYHLSH